MTASDDARPPFSPAIALLTIGRTVELELSALLERHGLTVRKYGILGHIAGDPGLSMSELARRSGITVQSMHALIRSLQDAGLVDAEVQSAGLPARLSVTPEGRAVLDRLAREVAALDARLFDGELEPVRNALAQVVAARQLGSRPS